MRMCGGEEDETKTWQVLWTRTYNQNDNFLFICSFFIIFTFLLFLQRNILYKKKKNCDLDGRLLHTHTYIHIHPKVHPIIIPLYAPRSVYRVRACARVCVCVYPYYKTG